MKNLVLAILLIFVSLSGNSRDRKPDQNPVAKGAKVTKAGGGYLFTEGPAVAPDGRVFFTDQPNDKIEVWERKRGHHYFSSAQ